MIAKDNAINIIERAIVPYNTSTNIITQKEKYHLFAPIAGLNKVGMAGFDSSQFVIRNGVVSIKSNIGNGTDFVTDDTLIYTNGVLSVNVANDVEQDNTRPISSAAVYTELGNINILLQKI